MRKSKFQVAKMMAIALVCVMAVVGCGGDGGDGGNGGNGGGGQAFLGAELNLTGQVWEINRNSDDDPITEENWMKFTGSREITSVGFETDEFKNIGGSGAITDGQFSFSVGIPAALVNIQEMFEDEFAEMFNDFKTIPSGTQIASIDNIYLAGGGKNRVLKQWRLGHKDTSGLQEEVYYLYVDRDVAITGGGKTDGGSMSKNLNVNLKTGWNVVTMKKEWDETTYTVSMLPGDSPKARYIISY